MSNPSSSPGFKRIAPFALIAVVALSLAAYGASRLFTPPKAEALQVLKVGNQLGGIRSVMEASGVLKDVPYKIEWSLFPAAAPLLEALSAGAVDTGGVGDAPFAFAYASGAKIKAVQAYTYVGAGRTSAILVPAGSPLKTARDLKGRKIATVRGSAGQDLALRILEREGLSAKDVTFVFLSNGDAKAALATGAVDAWSTWGSYVGVAVLHQGDRAIADATGLKRGYGFQVATDSAIAAKREILADFLHRLDLAYLWAQRNPEAHAAALARETGIPLDVARFTTEPVYKTVRIGPQLAADERETFERYRRSGVIAQIPDLTHAFDPSFGDADRP